jgi:putative ABC transport system permease protein
LLGMVGLFSILSSSVVERTRELGVRIALGAQPKRVRRMVVIQGMRVVGAGVIVGVIVVLFGARALDSLLYGVRSLDPLTLATTSLLMLLVGVAACWIPAYRASSVDPARTLTEG